MELYPLSWLFVSLVQHDYGVNGARASALHVTCPARDPQLTSLSRRRYPLVPPATGKIVDIHEPIFH
jgi:hypothetical protein